MKFIWILLIVLLTFYGGNSQSNKNFRLSVNENVSPPQIEITPYIRTDWYPEFIEALNPVNYSKVKIKGKSWGIQVNYKFPWESFFLKAGLGYYRYSFNNISDWFSLTNQTGNVRSIDYTPPAPIVPTILYSTDRYWYNTINLNLGIEKKLSLGKKISLITGLDLGNYFAFSEYYHVPQYLTADIDYKGRERRYFGFSGNAHVSLQKTWRRIGIGPIAIIPVFGKWKQDRVFFDEKNSDSRSKWGRGIGVGVNFSYQLNQKTKQ